MREPTLICILTGVFYLLFCFVFGFPGKTEHRNTVCIDGIQYFDMQKTVKYSSDGAMATCSGGKGFKE